MGVKSQETKDDEGFEKVWTLVGGHGRFQWWSAFFVSIQLVVMVWNHLGYIFIGAVPKHWCHIPALDESPWSLEQIRNLSIPRIYAKSADPSTSEDWKYDQCHFYNLDYGQLLIESDGDFDTAYSLAQQSDTVKCHTWSYDKSIYLSTIVTEFDLVCDKRYLVASIQALYMIGALLGTLIFSPLNDKILGRRRAALVGVGIVLIAGLCTCFSTSYWMFVFSRIFVAIGTAGCMQATAVWQLEHCDPQTRAKLYCISSTFFGVGYALMPIYAYFFRSWFHLQLAFTSTSFILISYYWVLAESPRWLATQGLDDKAVKALLRIARYNKVHPPPEREDLLECVRKCHLLGGQSIDSNDGDSSECTQPSKLSLTPRNGGESSERKNRWILTRVTNAAANFSTLVKTPELRKISFVMWTLFVAVAFVYYGFAFSSNNITTSPYLVVSLGGLMEVPASVFPIPFLNYWGRRPAAVLFFLGTGLASMSIALTPAEYEGLRTVLSMAGKLFVASAFTVLYLVVSEAYPTVARSTGQGAGTLMGRVGSISAPFVADLLTTVYPDLPSVIFGIVALSAAAFALFIPEMKSVGMKDQVHEYKDKELRSDSDKP